MVDGAVARAGNTVTAFGGVLDSSCDRIADAAIFGGLLWYFAQHGQKWLLLAALLCLILGALTSYIRARAEAAGLNATVGIAERAERLIIVLVGTGLTGPPFHVPYLQPISLWLLVAASTITVGQRFAAVYRQARDQATDRPAPAREDPGRSWPRRGRCRARARRRPRLRRRVGAAQGGAEPARDPLVPGRRRCRDGPQRPRRPAVARQPASRRRARGVRTADGPVGRAMRCARTRGTGSRRSGCRRWITTTSCRGCTARAPTT